MRSCMERAEKIARHIVTMPPVAVRMMKEFVVRFGDLPTDQAWHVQNLINNLLIQVTTDGEEGRQRVQREAPAQLHRRAAAARRGVGGAVGGRRQAAGRGVSQRRVLSQRPSACAKRRRPSVRAGNGTNHRDRFARLARRVAESASCRRSRPSNRAATPARPIGAARRSRRSTIRAPRAAPLRYRRRAPARGRRLGRSWRATAGPAERLSPCASQKPRARRCALATRSSELASAAAGIPARTAPLRWHAHPAGTQPRQAHARSLPAVPRAR